MDERPRITKCAPKISITAAATPTLIYQVSTGRTAKLVKLIAYDGQAADVTLEIGTYVAPTFTRRLPRVHLVAGFDYQLGELDCPEFEFEADIYAQASAAGAAPNDIEVQVTVEEIG